MTLTAIQIRIQQVAGQRAFLLKKLEETSTSPEQLKEHERYIRVLDDELLRGQERCEYLNRVRTSELKGHERYRDSTLRKFVHRASGRKEQFEERAANEESQYFDTIQALKAAEDKLARNIQLKAAAEQRRRDMIRHPEQHRAYQIELDSLYDHLFAGHNPEFPEEDFAEEACTLALANLEHVSEQHEREVQVVQLLQKCESKLLDAKRHLHGAWIETMNTTAKYNCETGESSGMRKLKCLRNAVTTDEQIHELEQTLKFIAPELGNLGLYSFMRREWTRVSDYGYVGRLSYENILRTLDVVNAALERCKTASVERICAQRRLSNDKNLLREQMQVLRLELRKAREDCFEKVLSGKKITPVPPRSPTTSAAGPSVPPPDSPRTAPPQYEPPRHAPPPYSA